jgi:hypothetical protein
MALLLGGSVAAQERGRCVTVDVPAEFVTPDRVTHEPGSLKLCVERVHSPVSILHKVYIDGHAVGLLQGRTGRSEGPATSQPYVQFRWNGRGKLLLVGYAWPDGKRMRTHILACGAESGSPALEACVPEFARNEIESGFVLAAARVN